MVQVYGAITYYLAHRDEVDRYLESRRQDFAAARQAARATRRCPLLGQAPEWFGMWRAATMGV